LLQYQLSEEDHINQGENDNESLAEFKDETIRTRLKDKIYYSSSTIVMISPGMIDPNKAQADQWIPWEVAYSLRNQTRNGRLSGANAMIAVVIPDLDGSYDYFVTDQACGSRMYKTNTLFRILEKNMFNRKTKDLRRCACGSVHEYGDFSYILTVKWHEFFQDINGYLESAYRINENVDDFELCKTP
jgi:hypothetical protein